MREESGASVGRGGSVGLGSHGVEMDPMRLGSYGAGMDPIGLGWIP